VTAAAIDLPTIVQLGMSWSPHQQGHGSDRYFAGLVQSLHRIGCRLRPCVVGSASDVAGSDPPIHVAAEPDASMRQRRAAFARHVHASGRMPGSCLVASHFAGYASPLGWLGRRVPHVVHFHGPWAAESAVEGGGRGSVWAKGWLERRTYRRAQRVIALSRAFGDLVIRDYGVAAERVRVVPGGIDTAAYKVPLTRAEARERIGWTTDRPIVLCVRRLSRRMGLDRLIDAVASVRQSVPDVLVLIGGKGQEAQALQQRIRERGMTDHVRLIGFVSEDDLPTAYRAADLSIVPSWALEGFGLVCLESLAAGTPVLVTPVGGLPEVVRSLSPGLVMASSDPRDMADALIAALKGADLPDAAACQRYVWEHFDWSVIAPRVLEVYREAVEVFGGGVEGSR